MDASFALPDSSDYSTSELPKAVDLSHHLNLLARSRRANTLKSLYQVSLCAGVERTGFFQEGERLGEEGRAKGRCVCFEREGKGRRRE